MTTWLAVHLPFVSARFVAAGHAVSHSLAEQERIGVIHGAFWNMQALSELMVAQSTQFNGVTGCRLNDDLGVTREVLQDQIFIALDLKNMPVERSMAALEVSDPYDEKAIIMDGIILDAAGVLWRDDQIAQLVKFRLEPPGDKQ